MGDPSINASQSQSSSVNDDDEIHIYLKVRSTIDFKAKRTHTVGKLKEMFCSKEGVSESLQELFFAGEHLEDDQTLADCGINRNSTVDLVLHTMSVFARKLFIKIPSTQRTVVILAKVHDTIQRIKSIVRAREGISESEDFNLMHDRMFLENSQTLASLNIGNDSTTFYLVYHPRDVQSISVHIPTDAIIELQVKQLQTIGDVKALVGCMTDTNFEFAKLVYAGKALEDSRSFASYNLKEKTLLDLAYPFRIYVRLWNGKSTLPVDVLSSDSIMDVNSKVFKKLGLPASVQPIFFDGKKLDDNRTLASYCIQKDSTLEMGRSRAQANEKHVLYASDRII